MVRLPILPIPTLCSLYSSSLSLSPFYLPSFPTPTLSSTPVSTAPTWSITPYCLRIDPKAQNSMLWVFTSLFLNEASMHLHDSQFSSTLPVHCKTVWSTPGVSLSILLVLVLFILIRAILLSHHSTSLFTETCLGVWISNFSFVLKYLSENTHSRNNITGK